MQVLQWLFKVSQDQKQAKDHHQAKASNLCNEEITPTKVKEKAKELVHYKHKRVHRKAQKPEETALDCKNFRYLTLLLRRGNSRAYFSSTLHQRRLSGLNQRQKQHYILSMKMKKEDLVRGLGIGHNKADSSAHVGNKVLPICDSTTSSSSLSSLASTSKAYHQQQCGPSSQKDDRVKGSNQKTKTLSRMKELLRWAAAAKSEKGGKLGRKVLHFRNKSATVKSGAFDDQLSNDSPKISFRWEVESNSTTCSAASAPPSLLYDRCSHRTGSWITTDDEFVVLEL